MPARSTPATIAGNANLNLIPRRKAATLPVHAPVTGSGIITNKISPKDSYFSISFERLKVCLNHQSKKRSNNLNRLNRREMGPNSRSKGITGIKLPITAIM